MLPEHFHLSNYLVMDRLAYAIHSALVLLVAMPYLVAAFPESLYIFHCDTSFIDMKEFSRCIMRLGDGIGCLFRTLLPKRRHSHAI